MNDREHASALEVIAKDIIDELRAENERALRFISMEGYRRCDIPACNCPYWHGGNASQRLRELDDALPYENGSTILKRTQKLVAENESLRAALAEHLPPCGYKPEELVGVPLGMHHCPECGTMVVAGCPHGPVDVECWAHMKVLAGTEEAAKDDTPQR
jgi:hypothetical protein